MDKLLEESKALNKDEVVETKRVEVEQQKSSLNSRNDVLTNIYLSSQKNSIASQSIIAKHEGVKIAKEAKGIEDVKTSAKQLDLELQEAKVEIKDNTQKQIQKNDLLEKFTTNKNMMQEITNNNTSNAQASSSASTKANEGVDVNINVPNNLAMSIQSRIIGAQQQMSSMMSDVARSMYENYKPPVTAFRINLLPAQLGSIAILMKSDRDSNGINISLNISNSSTLDAFANNETGLRNALLKSFDSDTEFNLSFASDDSTSSDSQSQDSNSSNQQQNQQNRRETPSSTDILNSLNNSNKKLKKVHTICNGSFLIFT